LEIAECRFLVLRHGSASERRTMSEMRTRDIKNNRWRGLTTSFGERCKVTHSLPALLLAVSSNKGGTVKRLRARRSFRPTGDTMMPHCQFRRDERPRLLNLYADSDLI
jgi:hypothetical protein